MKKPEIPGNEAERLNALLEYSILDTIPEKDFDDITKLASQICGTPISLISLIDDSRQWFKSAHGLNVRETAKDFAFCAHAINKPHEIMIVPDSRLDSRFADNPLVSGDPHVIFYAGVPLVTPQGFPLGTICIIDNKPKELDDQQISALKAISNQVVKLLELRKKNIELDESRIVLERTLNFFEQTGKVAKVGGWEVDVEKQIVIWTQITKEIHEVPENFVPELETGINFYKEGESREMITTLINNAIQYGTPFDTKLQIITYKGNERWVRAIGYAEFVNGNCKRLYGVFQDIHAQKLKDIQLERSEELFKNIFDNSKAGMSLVSPDMKWVKVNKALCDLLGYTEQELLVMGPKDVTHPGDLVKTSGREKNLLTGSLKNFEDEKRYFHKSGAVVWVIISVSVVRDENNKPLYNIAQTLDITDRKMAEQILAEERKLLSTLIDNIPVNIFIKDHYSRKILVNQKEIEYIGAKDETDILGKDDFELYPEDSALISVEEDQQVLNTGEPIIDKETHNTRFDGTEHWFLTSKIPLRNVQDEITGLLGISYDISERKRSEQKLKDLLDVTSEQNIRLTNFAHIVSHNLRSHATNFSMLLNFLETEKEETSRQEMFNLLKKASVNLTETVAHLNEVVAVNTNISKEIQSVNLYDAIQKVQDNVKALLIREQVTCINEVDRSWNIPVVPAYLESILLNFLTNGIKYRSPQKNAFVKMTAKKEANYVVLYIQDNGLGIDMKRNAEKLFGMYKTFHGNKDARGVGLFITKNQIEAMGGKVEAESAIGEGTTFKIYFNEQN